MSSFASASKSYRPRLVDKSLKELRSECIEPSLCAENWLPSTTPFATPLS